MHKASFITVPNRNPKRAPAPERNADLMSASPKSSPTIAPKNGPRINPHGRKNNPITEPMNAPQLPHLVPPLYLLPSTGIK